MPPKRPRGPQTPMFVVFLYLRGKNWQFWRFLGVAGISRTKGFGKECPQMLAGKHETKENHAMTSKVFIAFWARAQNWFFLGVFRCFGALVKTGFGKEYPQMLAGEAQTPIFIAFWGPEPKLAFLGVLRCPEVLVKPRIWERVNASRGSTKHSETTQCHPRLLKHLYL